MLAADGIAHLVEKLLGTSVRVLSAHRIDSWEMVC
jgi:hypothetical protein